MKKFLAMLVVVAAMTSMVGCGDPAPAPTGGSKPTTPAPTGGTKPAETKKM